MDNSSFAWRDNSTGETAVDGLMAGIVAGLIMALFLVTAGLLSDNSVTLTLGYFDPAKTGNWVTGLLAHMAVSAIYGLVFVLLMRFLGWIRPIFLRPIWLWGVAYGLLLLAIARGFVLTDANIPLTQIDFWQFGVAHLLYGLVLGLRLIKK